MEKEPKTLALAPDELLAEHGVDGSAVLSVEERVGTAVGLLGQARKALYGDRPSVPLDRVDALESIARMNAAQPILTRLWIHMVAIEASVVTADES